jgi:2,4-dienoyl-CoA reductase-like NADH-dependent reductase (Old Yellow Enzyme family)
LQIRNYVQGMLFTPITFRDVTLKNRVVVSPMCQYSSEDGFASDWHLVHLGSRAVGGASLVFTEATAVTPEGRISPQDLGLWKDAHAEMLGRIAKFVRAQGAEAGVQLAHAGRKGSTARPWEGGGPVPPEKGGFGIVAPSAIPFREKDQVPRELDEAGIARIVHAFAEAADRAHRAGFTAIELHAAHGYLLHEFLSPLANRRTDRYGGSIENRARMLLETVRAVRSRWPERLPLFVRVSATDWVAGGWTADDTVWLARRLKDEAVDLLDCSSGGSVPGAQIPVGPGYQVPFAERVRREAGMPAGAVGLIRSAYQADQILRGGQADVVVMARQLLRDPYWPLHAARELGVDLPWPPQYQRAKD